VAAIAVDVDVAGGRLVIDPPAGLLDLASAGPAGQGGSAPRDHGGARGRGTPGEPGEDPAGSTRRGSGKG
jgi:hypothetical protein